MTSQTLGWLATARQRPKPGAPDLAAFVVAEVEETFSRDQAKSSYFPEIPATNISLYYTTEAPCGLACVV